MATKSIVKAGANSGRKLAKKSAPRALGKTVGKVAGQVLEAINPLDVIRDITSAVLDHKKTKAQEETKRRQIDAWETATLANIRAKRDILLTYLERSFDERRENFKRLFDDLDRALDSSRTDQLAPILQGIVLLAQESPFKQLSSLAGVREFMEDRDTPVEF